MTMRIGNPTKEVTGIPIEYLGLIDKVHEHDQLRVAQYLKRKEKMNHADPFIRYT